MERTLILFVGILAVLGPCCRAEFGEECTTPDGRAGICTSLRACPMLRQCNRQRTRFANITGFLQRSACGIDNAEKTAYCCEKYYHPSTTSKISNPCYPEVLPPMLEKFPSVCGEDVSQRIYGGNISHPTEYPWVVVLEYDTPDGPKSPCGGSLISNRYVMTAAHCITPLRLGWTLTGVRVGEYDKTRDPDCFKDSATTEDCMPSIISFKIEKKYVHENWKSNDINRPNDIAVLKLASPVTFSRTVKPICLPGTNDSPASLIVAGWGETENSIASDIKLKVTVPLVPLEQCNNMYTRDNLHLERHMCAGSKGLDSCKGDSGGPLMAAATDMNGMKRWTAFGVVSFGPWFCGTAGSPGIYTKVSAYIEWIIEKMQID